MRVHDAASYARSQRIDGGHGGLSASQAIAIISKQLEHGWPHFLNHLNTRVSDARMWDHLSRLNDGVMPFIPLDLDMRRLHVHEKVEILALELGLEFEAAHKVALHFEALFLIWLYGGHMGNVEMALPHQQTRHMVLEGNGKLHKIEYSKPQDKGTAKIRVFFDGEWVSVNDICRAGSSESLLIPAGSITNPAARQYILEHNFESAEDLVLELSTLQQFIFTALSEAPEVSISQEAEGAVQILLTKTDYRKEMICTIPAYGQATIIVRNCFGQDVSIDELGEQDLLSDDLRQIKAEAQAVLMEQRFSTPIGREKINKALKQLQAYSSFVIRIYEDQRKRRLQEDEEAAQDQQRSVQIMEKQWPK